MKRAGMLGVCLFLALTPAAYAFDSVEAAYAAMIRAGSALGAEAEAALTGEAQQDIRASLTTFSETAAEASAAMDAHGGPVDLRCIYRGMAEDAQARAMQLASAKLPEARMAALEDIQFLAEDAVLVTPETQLAEADPLAGLPPMTCAASAMPIGADLLKDMG